MKTNVTGSDSLQECFEELIYNRESDCGSQMEFCTGVVQALILAINPCCNRGNDPTFWSIDDEFIKIKSILIEAESKLREIANPYTEEFQDEVK